MFKELEESFVAKKLPYFWDNNLNLYEDILNKINNQWLYNINLIIKRLQIAAIQLTLPLQRRIYGTFCKLTIINISLNKLLN